MCNAVVFKIPEAALAGHLRFVKDLIAVTVKLESAVIRHGGIVTDVRGNHIAGGNGLLGFQTDGNIQIPPYTLDTQRIVNALGICFNTPQWINMLMVNKGAAHTTRKDRPHDSV